MLVKSHQVETAELFPEINDSVEAPVSTPWLPSKEVSPAPVNLLNCKAPCPVAA